MRSSVRTLTSSTMKEQDPRPKEIAITRQNARKPPIILQKSLLDKKQKPRVSVRPKQTSVVHIKLQTQKPKNLISCRNKDTGMWKITFLN
jgi:hypothetical protein